MWRETGLTNGSQGSVIAIIYRPGLAPPNIPDFVLVQFDQYVGPSFLPNIERVVPIFPVRNSWFEKKKEKFRLQLPLIPGYAISIHNSQGMSLDRVMLNVASKEDSCGITYTGMSRVKDIKNLAFKPMPTLDRFKSIFRMQMFKERMAEEKRLARLEEKTIRSLMEDDMAQDFEIGNDDLVEIRENANDAFGFDVDLEMTNNVNLPPFEAEISSSQYHEIQMSQLRLKSTHRKLMMSEVEPHLPHRLLSVNYRLSAETKGDGNCFLHAIIDQLRYLLKIKLMFCRFFRMIYFYSFDPDGQSENFKKLDHKQLRKAIVESVDANTNIDFDTFRIGTKEAWKKRMIRDGQDVSDTFISCAATYLGREIHILPVFKEDATGPNGKIIISDPNCLNELPPFNLLHYNEDQFASPHFQSIRLIQ